MLPLLVLLAVQPATPPSPQALALGRRLAGSGTLAAILPMMIEKDLGDLGREDAALSGEDRQALDRIGRAEARTGTERMLTAMGRAYAERLSIADLKVLAADAERPATRRMRAMLPAAVAQATGAVGDFDLKKRVAARMCAERGKLCRRP